MRNKIPYHTGFELVFLVMIKVVTFSQIFTSCLFVFSLFCILKRFNDNYKKVKFTSVSTC